MGYLNDFQRWPAKRFIETGLGEGLTLSHACKAYEECISIELNEGRYLAGLEMFKDKPNVHIYHGNSPDILKRVIDPAIHTMFWLDAHYVRGDDPFNETHGLCPILEELAIIKAQPWAENPIILVDDWTTFRMNIHGWPTLKELSDFMGHTIRRHQELPGNDAFSFT